MVNGEVLLPGGQSLNSGSVLKSQYNFTGDDDSVFGLAITNRKSGSKMMNIVIRNKKLVEGEIYELRSSASNSVGSYNDLHMGGFVTNDDHGGELYISKIDTERHIASGTFWFDATDNEGNLVQIRMGRFDVQYYTSNTSSSTNQF